MLAAVMYVVRDFGHSFYYLSVKNGRAGVFKIKPMGFGCAKHLLYYLF